MTSSSYGHRRWRRRALIAAVGAAPCAVAVAAPASAAWSTAGSGATAGAAATMPTGSAPSGSAAASQVTISWGAVTLSSGAAVQGYVVRRYDAVNGSEATVGVGARAISDGEIPDMPGPVLENWLLVTRAWTNTPSLPYW